MRNRDGKALEPPSTEWLREAIREQTRWFNFIMTLSTVILIMALTVGFMLGRLSVH